MDLPKRMKSIGKNIWPNVSQRMNFALIAVRDLRLSWSSRWTFSTLFVSLIAIKTRSILNRSTIESAAEMTMGFQGLLTCFFRYHRVVILYRAIHVTYNLHFTYNLHTAVELCLRVIVEYSNLRCISKIIIRLILTNLITETCRV